MATLEAAAEKFWADVKELLMEEYRHDDRSAAKGVEDFQREAERHGFVGAVFNQGEEQTAAAVDGMIREGAARMDRS